MQVPDGFRRSVVRKISRCNLIGNRPVIPHDTLPQTVVRHAVRQIEHLDKNRVEKRILDMKTKSLLLLICFFIDFISSSVFAQVVQRDTAIVSQSARLETVFSGGINTEGPAAALDGSIFFVDVPISQLHDSVTAGRIWRFDHRTGKSTVYRSPSGKAIGLKFDADGRMVVAEFADFGGRRITRTDLATGKAEIIAALFQGKPFNGPNDLTIDEKGRIYFTDYGYNAPHEVIYHRGDGVYRIDPKGTIERIINHAGKPNGIAISPDQKTIYIASNQLDIFGTSAILAYDLSNDGKVVFRSIFEQFEPNTVLPDGMTFDTEGNLYVALFSRIARTGVVVYSPKGKEIAFIPTPERAKNVAFGRGNESNLLYITAGKSLYRISVTKTGYQLPPIQR